MSPRLLDSPAMLRALPQRPSMLQARMTQGPVKVLQSNRTPTQLSLFERPSIGR